MSEQKFNKPLNQWVEEDVPVEERRFIPHDPQDLSKGGRITTATRLEKMRTMYIHAPYQKARCKKGQHIFRVANVHKWMFSCTLCPYSFRASPLNHTFIDGKLIRKDTGAAV